VVAELLGWFGAALSCLISLPQVVRTMRAKRLDGISSATYWLVLANAAAWTACSLLTGEYVAGVPALVNGPIAIVILHRLVATRHTARRSEFIPRFAKAFPSDSLTSGRQWPTDVPGGNTYHTRNECRDEAGGAAENPARGRGICQLMVGGFIRDREIGSTTKRQHRSPPSEKVNQRQGTSGQRRAG
jgi:uncharacterized protein with PQ loop repeat